MPIYEYRCNKCQHTLEALQKMSDPPLRKCPECGKAGLQKLVSAASFRLKGGGWYETDFKTGDKKQLANSDSAESPAGKGDDKPASAGADSGETSGKDKAKAEKSGAGKEAAAGAPAKAAGSEKGRGNDKGATKPTTAGKKAAK